MFSDGILETLDMSNMDHKESYLLNAITEAKGDFDSIIVSLNLEQIKNVPDDIAVMSVSSK
jgi:phosphoserine phosphatase RsbU/P